MLGAAEADWRTLDPESATTPEKSIVTGWPRDVTPGGDHRSGPYQRGSPPAGSDRLFSMG